MKPTFSLALTLLAAPLLTAAPLPDALLQEAEQAVRQVHARADAGLWDTQRAIRADATLLRIRLAKARADGDQAAAKTHAQALRDTLQAAARQRQAAIDAALAGPDDPAKAYAEAALARHLWHARDLLGGDEAALKARYQAAAARHAILAEPPARAEADAWLAEALAL